MSNPPSPTADAVVTVASVTGDAPLLLPAPRKFPAPCWTQDETTALINAYKDKWYALRCRNLRSADWDSVASDLSSRCPTSTPNPKTSAQCRHKMEKLRKRYRTEKQRSLNHPNPFFSSSWSFFDLMDSMETGSSSNGGSGSAKPVVPPRKHPDFTLPNTNTNNNHTPVGDLSAVPIKFKFKSHASSLGFEDATRFDRHLDAEEEQHHQHQHRYGGGGGGYDSRSSRFLGGDGIGGGYYDSSSAARFESRVPNGGFARKSRAREEDRGDGDPESVVSEMVRSIRVMGEGFVKMEKMKVEMVREIERMRMEAEMKRSEMILESQQLIVNAFVEGLLGAAGGGSTRKKTKKVKLVE